MLISVSAAVVAGQETEVLIGMKNDGTILFLIALVVCFRSGKWSYLLWVDEQGSRM